MNFVDYLNSWELVPDLESLAKQIEPLIDGRLAISAGLHGRLANGRARRGAVLVSRRTP
jgi:hypothetical protein